jgi:hypothetical protein
MLEHESAVTNEPKETLEVLDVGLTFAELLYDEIKEDGFQATDIVKVISSEKFLIKVRHAFTGATLVPGELQSLKGLGALAMVRKVVDSAERVLVKYEKAF